MEQNLVYVLMGAFAALAVVFVFLLLRELGLNLLLPLWRRWRYRGVNISGGWKGLGNDPAPVPGAWIEVGATFEQRLHDVQGVLSIRRCAPDDSAELRFRVCGQVGEGCVTLAPCGGEAPLASALLRIEGRGASLNGQLLFCAPGMEGVEGIQLSVHRAKSMVLPRLRPTAEAAGASA